MSELTAAEVDTIEAAVHRLCDVAFADIDPEPFLRLIDSWRAAQAERTDLALALSVQAGLKPMWGLSDGEKAAITRAFAILKESRRIPRP